MIKMKKLSATTFAMALSLGGLALGAGCEKGDEDKDTPAPSAGPSTTDPKTPVAPPDNKMNAQPMQPGPTAGAGATGTPEAEKPATDTPTHTLPANKEPAPASCAGSPKGCGPKPPTPPAGAQGEIKAGTGGTKLEVGTKVEAKAPGDEMSCSPDGCGAPPPKKVETKPATGPGPATNSCGKKSCG